MIRLSDIRDSFEGVIPSVIATTDSQGIPNVSYLSHVHYIDEQHVALTNQYFSKTAQNVAANGMATLMVVDGYSGLQHILDLTYVGQETEGKFFDRISMHLDVVSTEQGMGAMMRLKAVDIYKVEDCRAVPPAHPLAEPDRSAETRRNHLELTSTLMAQLDAQNDPERLLDTALEGLETLFGFRHTMALVPDLDRQQLTTIASRGYDRQGVGSEVAFGDGAIGIAAKSGQPVRIADMSRGRRYVSAVKATSPLKDTASLPLPGLAAPVCQLAVPMRLQNRLCGVLFAESEQPFSFRHADEEALLIIARHLALALKHAQQDQQSLERPASGHSRHSAELVVASSSFSLRFYPRDGSVFIDDDYLIRGVPGRLLYLMTEEFLSTGRQEFLNKEIRRNPNLFLPDFKDNLETRLILLRRRLEEKGGPIRLMRSDRGRHRLEFDAMPVLSIIEES